MAVAKPTKMVAGENIENDVECLGKETCWEDGSL